MFEMGPSDPSRQSQLPRWQRAEVGANCRFLRRAISPPQVNARWQLQSGCGTYVAFGSYLGPKNDAAHIN